MRLSWLNVGLLDEFLRSKVGTVSESTRDHTRSLLCQICEWATGRDIVLKNYAKYTAPITVPKYEPTVLAPGHARRLLGAAWAHPLGGVVIIGILTGMREGEILGLLWSKIRDGELVVDTTLTRVRGGRAKGGSLKNSPTNKTDNPRNQPVVDVIQRVLDIRRAVQAEDQRACPEWRWQDTDYIFTTSVGTPVDKKNFLTRVWSPLLALAGLAHMRFHDLRHSQATLLRELGYDLKARRHARADRGTNDERVYLHQPRAQARDCPPRRAHPTARLALTCEGPWWRSTRAHADDRDVWGYSLPVRPTHCCFAVARSTFDQIVMMTPPLTLCSQSGGVVGSVANVTVGGKFGHSPAVFIRRLWQSTGVVSLASVQPPTLAFRSMMEVPSAQATLNVQVMLGVGVMVGGSVGAATGTAG